MKTISSAEETMQAIFRIYVVVFLILIYLVMIYKCVASQAKT